MIDRYLFNPECHCEWCENGGRMPADDGSRGHSWCYEHPHIDPPDGAELIAKQQQCDGSADRWVANGTVRALVRAGALIAAAIDRLQVEAQQARAV